MRHLLTLYPALTLALLALLGANLLHGSVSIPPEAVCDILNPLSHDPHEPHAQWETWRYIILHARLPGAITATLTGAAISICGLLLQSFFRNPLAGPSTLGITSGAHLAVALTTLFPISLKADLIPSLITETITTLSPTLAAVLGAGLVLSLLVALSYKTHPITLLVIGLLISYMADAVITILHYYAESESAHSLLLWGMGDFSSVILQQIPTYSVLICGGIIATLWLIKPLNAWMLGEEYSKNLGIRLTRTKTLILVITGTLTAITTAHCGPISFIGLATPHIARLFSRTDDHRHLLPLTALSGATIALLCLFMSTLPSDGRLLPINALTPIIGIPIVIYVILRKK